MRPSLAAEAVLVNSSKHVEKAIVYDEKYQMKMKLVFILHNCSSQLVTSFAVDTHFDMALYSVTSSY